MTALVDAAFYEHIGQPPPPTLPARITTLCRRLNLRADHGYAQTIKVPSKLNAL